MKSGIVRLIDLPKNEILLRVSNVQKNKISKKRKERFKNLCDMANFLKENKNTLIGFFWHNTAIPIKLFLKIVKLFKIKSYDRCIVWIGGRTQGKGIKDPKIPFNFNTEDGGKFIASVLGDGTFLYNFEIQYRNYCPLMLNEVLRTANNLFGKVQLVGRDATSITFPLILGKIIKVLDVKQGRKTVTNPSIPKFIMNGGVECKIGFLKQISDDEGSAQINPPYSYSIRYEFAREIPKTKILKKEDYIPQLLKDLNKLVKELGYSTTRIYGGRIQKGKIKPRFIVSFAFDIQGKSSLEKFAKEAGFRIPKRKAKLEWGLKKIKIERVGDGKGLPNAFCCFRNIYKKIGYVDKYTLSKEMKKTLRNSQEWLRKMTKKGLIKQVNGNKFIGGGFCGLKGKTPSKYILTKENVKIFKKAKDSIRILPRYQ